MQGFRAKSRIVAVVILAIWIGLAALYGLLKPISNGCVMTYMYPTYIPISSTEGVSSAKYGLFLYHEGWKKIDYKEHLKKLSGVPVLFIPGNGGSYKQVRSLAAESDRAYQGGPLESTFYQEASLTPEEGGLDADLVNFQLPNQYSSRLDWFAVDLEGEHSAMDGGILEEHTEYVVYAIHRILDQYKESYDARKREGAAASGILPKSVLLVGHSMGGFVARAALIHPHLRRSAVETVLTLSSPHQSPPLALQPSLGYYFARVNNEWRKGYEVQTTRAGHYASDPVLSHVVVISITGGYNDYQVRSKLESLDGIVPPTHGLVISSTGMKNVWLSMEHQAILWCNQLVVQVSHTLLSLIDSRTGQPFANTRRRMSIFSGMLRSAIPHSFSWKTQSQFSVPMKDVKDSDGSIVHASTACPSNFHWGDDGLERDLYIQTTTVPVLAMDGRRRWLDIQKLGSNGKSHFMFVTNLAPCTGVRLHLWPEKGKSASELPSSKRVLEVTSRMVHIPSGPAPRQIEPGSQTEQPPPSAVFVLRPEDMRGFRFLTISVAPRPTISGRPPPAASMAVGQFFDPKEGKLDVSPWFMLQSSYSHKEMFFKENHPLALNLSFSISLGLLPITLSLKTAGCGIKKSGLPDEEAEDVERLCKLRCFPPIAFAWDDTSGLHVFPNLFSERIVVDSSPALWSSTPGSEKTNVLLLVDPHCAYKTTVAVSFTQVASRFLLVYNSQIVGFSVVVVLFALMWQAHAWDLDLPIPSMLTAVESNLKLPLPFFCLGVAPILLSLLLSFLMSQPLPLFASFTLVSMICYLLANGWQLWEGNIGFGFVQWFFSLSSGFSSLKVIRILRVNPSLATALAAITLACLLHPALGLFILLFSHALCCHSALCSFLTASFRSHAQKKELLDCKKGGSAEQLTFTFEGTFDQDSPSKEGFSSNSPDSSESYGETQLELFHHRHGLLILHLIAALMFLPSLAAWLQRIGMGESLPWLLDSVLCTGVILHGICNAKPEYNSYLFSFPGIPIREMRLSFIYLLAGYYSYLSGLALAPYRVFYIMAAIGVISFVLRMLQRRYRDKGETHFDEEANRWQQSLHSHHRYPETELAQKRVKAPGNSN
ncbi:GPI inositol-deacylase PGAP1-like [Parasponia andersonii]|uniref:GPI inositol-deacylase n=1 Tax=Parasponia andersonii TaxID=3476 RepID=A0A2P5B5G7_PARAD|nr:GPI inositol-deacylase PGAP1-like [Parasponia andersonii]